MADISGTTIWRWLSEDAIRPWKQRSWIFPRDPNFETKAGRVLDLYARTWDGKPLGKQDFVISADEKTSIQARVRCHPTLVPASRRAMRVEHEYDRAAPSPTSPPGTSTTPRSSGAANPPPASPPSAASSNKS